MRDTWFRQLARRALSLPLGPTQRPRNDRGAVLDRQIHAMLQLLERSGRPRLDELGAERARRETDRLSWLADVAPIALARIEDHHVEGSDARVRIYVPREVPRLPATVYLHGGGFVLGGLRSHDGLCRRLGMRSGSIVVAVDYRLAPEHPFPAAVEDACAVFAWIVERADELGIDGDRIAVAGDSAGGNLAAVLAQSLRGSGRPRLQLLIYPAVDLSRSSESHRTFADGYFLTEPMMDWFVASYLTDRAQESDPRGSPLVTRELAGVAPAHVVTAGFDPLRDEGEAYAHALMAAGVPTTLRCYDSLIHGFASMGGLIDAAEHAIDDCAEVLRRHLWP